MKATFQIPDALYREVKAETAREGRTLREVTISLFEGWLRSRKSNGTSSQSAYERNSAGEILIKGQTAPKAFARFYRESQLVQDHSLEAMRESIARGWDEGS